MPDYDAFLLVSFGGPEGPDDVMPFLRNVTRGRGIPDERLATVAEHYYAAGGVSPISQQCRDLIEALQADFPAAGLDLPIYWGNRNWDPYLTGTVATMAGPRRVPARRGSTRSAGTSTTRGSSSRSRRVRAPPWSSCRRKPADRPRWCSPRTACPV
jgi:ferrochelatase